MFKRIKIADLTIREPFKSLWPGRSDVSDAIRQRMEKEGFRDGEPVAVWGNTLVDGHTRVRCAVALGIKDVPVDFVSFVDEAEAEDYAISRQMDKGRLTDAQHLSAVELLNQRFKTTPNLASNDAKLLSPQDRKSAAKIAKQLGTSSAKVERTRTVIEHAPESVKAAVKTGKTSINKAYAVAVEAKAQKAASRPTLNRTTDAIEWSVWTWNPVTGCEHGCDYCYARAIAHRFDGDFKPRFHEDRLDAPRNTKPRDGEPPNIFVCSMADLFGKWVPKDWIYSVLEVVRDCPQWRFLFLTKNPRRYKEFDWPQNAWLGATIDRQRRVSQVEAAFRGLTASVRWVSCEPLLGPVEFKDMGVIDWLVIGAQTKPDKQPEWPWVESLAGQARANRVCLYFKPNLKVRPKEYPE